MQLVKETVNNYPAFMQEITQKVKMMLGEEFSIRIYKVTKNNSLELDSLVMLKKGKNFAPNIYLLPYYEAYMQGTSIKVLAERICSVYRSYSVPAMDDQFSYSYEQIRPFIIYRLVSYERNKKLLENIPYIKYLDMAITFHCLVREDNDGIGTIRITNEHMQMWDTSLQELHLLAMNNTKNLLPPTLRSMEEVILGMLGEEYLEMKEDDSSDKMLKSLIDTQDTSKEHKMYILSNSKGINGATCLLYDNILKAFSNQIHSDFYILPSSIHEVILVPYDKTITKEALSDMVRDVNHTQVARDEVLSDLVYYYSGKNNTISMD